MQGHAAAVLSQHQRCDAQPLTHMADEFAFALCCCLATGHSKRVTAAVWGQDSLLVTGSNDKTVRFWKHSPAEDAAAGIMGGSWECAATATEHEAEVRGLALHPSRVYGVSVSADASWAWWDLAEAKCLKQVGRFVWRDAWRNACVCALSCSVLLHLFCFVLFCPVCPVL